MNKTQRLARAERLLTQAENNPSSSMVETWLEMANVHIRLANATESMNVLTDKELAQAKKNTEIIKACGELASEMMALGGEHYTAGKILYDKLFYS